MQLTRIVEQLGKTHRPIQPDPVGCVIGRSWCQRLELFNPYALTAQQDIPLRDPLAGKQQVILISPRYHQQLHIGVVRRTHHVDGGPRHLGVIDQKVGATLVGDKNDGIACRDLIDQHRKMLAAPLRLGPEPGRQHRCRLLLLQRNRPGKYHGQHQLRIIARVEKRHREEGELIAHRQGLQLQIEAGIPIDIEPQGIAGRVFTDLLIVADEVQFEPVEILGVTGIKHHRGVAPLPHLLVNKGLYAHQLVIEIDLKLRNQRQQGRRRSEVQIQRGLGHHLVTPYGEIGEPIWQVAAQGESAWLCSHLLQRHGTIANRGIYRGQRSRHLCRRYRGSRQYQCKQVRFWFHDAFTVCAVGVPERKSEETRRGTKESSQNTSLSLRIQSEASGVERRRRQ